MAKYNPSESQERTMEINHYPLTPPREGAPRSAAGFLLNLSPGVASAPLMSAAPDQETIIEAGEPEMESQLAALQKQYNLQQQMLNQQYEEQRNRLAQEQQSKVHEYYKAMMVQKQVLYEQIQEEKRLQEQVQAQHERNNKLAQIKQKGPGEESAIASNLVKAKLRECLLSKGHHRGNDGSPMKHSPPEFRHWPQHSSLDQHSPPMSGLSPPLRGPSMLQRYDEHPLRKTVSEPNLKVKPKFSLRQKVMQRNSPLTSRREQFHRKKPPLMGTSSSSNVDSDSGPNSPPTSSQGSGSAGDTPMGKEPPGPLLPQQPQQQQPQPQHPESATFPLQMMTNMMKSMPNISIGQPRDKMKADQGNLTEAELQARVAAHYGMPLLTYFPTPQEDGLEGSLMEHQMRALETAQNAAAAAAHFNPDAATAAPTADTATYIPFMPPSGIPPFLDPRIRARPILNRTRSEPLPLPGQLWLQQHQLLLQQQHHQDQLLKDNHKIYLRQKLQNQLLQRSGSKNHMENVDEAAEARLVQEFNESREPGEDEVVADDPPHPSPKHHRQPFLHHHHHQASSPASSIPLRPLERAQSNPTIRLNYPRQPTPPTAASDQDTLPKPTTGVAYDRLMLNHSCVCMDDNIHPENPSRLRCIYARLEERGLINQCQLVKCPTASAEELQTCHSEAYVQMYGFSPRPANNTALETFLPRFGKLPCGGVGVDSDTVWNEIYTPHAARMAAGGVIELAFRVARGELHNGMALVRPPGHHAEDTQAMGFCYFNNIAVATKLLLERQKLKRILILDWDVHHGNSTQQLFYTDPRVLYVSVHRHDNGNFFPGTGAPEDSGIERGLGFNVNVAFSGGLNPPMGDAEYMAAFRCVVMPIIREYDPELIMVSAGFDGAAGHPSPLGGYNVSPECFGHMACELMSLANGKVVLVLEGGYEIKPICDSSEMCLRALLRHELPPLKQEEVVRGPSQNAIESIRHTFRCQDDYWPCLKRYEATVEWSLAEALRREQEEAETLRAFASLSVLPRPLRPVGTDTPPSALTENGPMVTTPTIEEQLETNTSEPMEQ